MTVPAVSEPSLSRSLVEQIERVVREAEKSQRPLELEPFRGQLFELFVMADAANLVSERPDQEDAGETKGGEVRLTADGLCRILAERWNLADATRDSFTNQTRLPPEHLARMRILWSLMRMWMEWAYAWKRWHEFHREAKNA